MRDNVIHCRMAQSFWLTIFLICNFAVVQWSSADAWSGRRLYAGDAYISGDFSASKFFGEVSSATVADASNQIPQDDLEYILSELWYRTGIAYSQRYRWDGGAAGLDAVLGRQSLGLGTAATRNAEDTLTNGENLPDGAAIINYINGRGFITDPNDSVQPLELDGTFSTVGLLKRLGTGSYTTVPDNSANWDQAFGWGNHANAGYLKPPQQNDSVDASELEVLFGPLGAGIMIHSASGVFATTPDNHVNWDMAYLERRQWDGGATNLNAATGRNSLGLGSAALSLATDFATFDHNHGTGTINYLTKWNDTNVV